MTPPNPDAHRVEPLTDVSVREEVTPAVTITVTPGGPYLVRGPVTITTEQGEQIGVDRATVALCRCGATARAPFCDGTHRVCATPPPDVAPDRISRP